MGLAQKFMEEMMRVIFGKVRLNIIINQEQFHFFEYPDCRVLAAKKSINFHFNSSAQIQISRRGIDETIEACIFWEKKHILELSLNRLNGNNRL